jgi:NAD(P)-dependent dehydrogenase (short-subunit alcohol dehydrogenase family)
MSGTPVVLVAGAAGGIGAAIAERFHRGGWLPLLADKDGDGLAALAARLGGVPFHAADLTTRAACRTAVESLLAASGGRLDALVNAAGIWREGPVEDCDEATFDLVMAVNVKACFFMSAAAIPALRATKGAILNLSSDAGLQGNSGAALYCASKGAVSQLTKALALDLAPDGVRVNAICPGDTDSPMLRFQADRYGGGDPSGYLANLLAKYPQGPGKARFIRPDEIAGLAFYLASREAEAITGANISIDFGYSAGK